MKTIFKEGDKVFDIQYGWGIVKRIDFDANYPIFCRFDNDKQCYSIDGKIISGAIPTLSFTEYSLEGFSQKRPEPAPEPGDVVWVRDMEYDNWMITYFRKFNPNTDAILRYGCNPRNSADSSSIYYYKYLTTKNPYENEDPHHPINW